LLLSSGPAEAFTCEQVVWAVQHFSEAELQAMAAPLGGISQADRAKARRCLRAAASRGNHIEPKAADARSSL
jgi:hypothetical protein